MHQDNITQEYHKNHETNLKTSEVVLWNKKIVTFENDYDMW